MPNLSKLTIAKKIEVLITQVHLIQEKINHISDTVEKQSKDIADAGHPSLELANHYPPQRFWRSL